MITFQVIEQSKIEDVKDILYIEKTIKLFGIVLYKYTYYLEYPKTKDDSKNKIGYKNN